MNKYLAFKELRRELASAYEVELKAISGTDRDSDIAVKVGKLELDFADADSQLSGSEARKILHEEMRGTLQTLLERYDRNLRGEAVGLGLELRGIAAAAALRDGLANADDEWPSATAKQAEAEKFSSELGAKSRDTVVKDEPAAAVPSLDEGDPAPSINPFDGVVATPDVARTVAPSVADSEPAPRVPPISVNDSDHGDRAAQTAPSAPAGGEDEPLDPFESLIKNIEEEYAAKTRDSGAA